MIEYKIATEEDKDKPLKTAVCRRFGSDITSVI